MNRHVWSPFHGRTAGQDEVRSWLGCGNHRNRYRPPVGQNFGIERFDHEWLWYRRVMLGPARTPIGLQLARTAKVASRAFDEALTAAGGSLPVWLVLISLKTQRLGNQRQLADAVGIQEATLSHHLNAMADQGLLTRERDPANRRVHQVRLTDVGEATFIRLRDAAIEFDQRLRAGISATELATLGRLLGRLAENATAPAAEPMGGRQ